jgi:hypothetical protein
MMTLVPLTGPLACADCGCEIDLKRYRRKVPRCDECEVAAAMAKLDEIIGRLKKGLKEVSRVDQVVTDVERRLTDGTWAPGDRLPRISDLEKRFSYSSVTIRFAIERLVGKGLLVKRGNSWFVSDPD